MGNSAAPKYMPLNDAEMAVVTSTIKKHRKQGDRHHQIIEKCLADWQAAFRAERESAGGADETLMAPFLMELYAQIFERNPTDSELAENIEQFKLYASKLDRQKAIAKLIESLVLSTEFAYRNEFGEGEPDEHGRRMMSPRNVSYALAYALTDASPDFETLTKAARRRSAQASREDYEREVRRMLKRSGSVVRSSTKTVQAANINPSVTDQPIRKLAVLPRVFSATPKRMKVFKDDSPVSEPAGTSKPLADLIEEARHVGGAHSWRRIKMSSKSSSQPTSSISLHIQVTTQVDESCDLDSLKKHLRVGSRTNSSGKEWEPEDVAPHEEFLLNPSGSSASVRKRVIILKSLRNSFKRMMEGHGNFISAKANPTCPALHEERVNGILVGRKQCSAGAGNRCAANRLRPIGTSTGEPGDYPPSQPATHPEPQGHADPSRMVDCPFAQT